MNKVSNFMTIQQVADELGVSTKTLRRWEEKGYFVPDRQETTNIRLYHAWSVGYWKKMLELDRSLRKHLIRLDGLRKELDKYKIEQDYVSGRPLKLFDAESARSFNNAYEEMDKWMKEHKKLLHELLEYPPFMVKATGENYEGAET